MTTEKVGAENHVARFEIGREPVSIRDANRFVDYSIPPPHPPLAFSSPRHCHYGPALSTLCWFPKWIASTKRLVVRNSMKNKGQTTLFHPAEISLTGDRCSFNACIRALLPPSFFSYFFLPWLLQGKFNFFLKRNREMKWCNVIVNTKIIG